jgi:hypothetical protein
LTWRAGPKIFGVKAPPTILGGAVVYVRSSATRAMSAIINKPRANRSPHLTIGATSLLEGCDQPAKRQFQYKYTIYAPEGGRFFMGKGKTGFDKIK